MDSSIGILAIFLAPSVLSVVLGILLLIVFLLGWEGEG